MSDREELLALRRLAELEARAGAQPASQTPATPQAAPQAPQAPQAPAPRTTAEQLGLGTRATAQGLLGLPGLVYDVAAVPQNLLSNVPGLEWMRAKPAAQQVSEAATAIGLPEPRDAGERIMGAAIQGAAALPTGYGLGGVVRQQAGAAGQRLADVLQAAPVQQAVMGVAGGAGSQAAQEVLPEGASPAAKAVAGVAGGVAGAAAPSLALGAARRAVTPLPARLTEEERRLVQVAQREGVDLPVGAQTGSPTVKLAESALARLPGSAGAAQNQQQLMREQFQGAVMRTTGEAATDVRPETLDRAFGRIGQQFDDLIAQTPQVRLDRDFFRAVDDIERDYVRRMDVNIRPPVTSYIDEFNLVRRAPNAAIPGDAYQNISSNLKRMARSNQNPEARFALNQLANALDDAVERQFSGPLRQEWRETRQQYRNLLAIDDAASKGTAQDRAAGNLPLGAFQQAVRAQDKAGFGRGRGQLNDLARLGGFIADKIPSSGTSERTQMANALSLAPVGGGGMIGMATGNPILGMAAGAAAPWAVQRALQSAPGRAYLTNQLMAGPTPLSGDARRAALINALQQGISP
jgi:hypothetical protein